MREVPTTEAKSRFAELLRVVEYGESIAITRHGKTVAHLVPAVLPRTRFAEGSRGALPRVAAAAASDRHDQGRDSRCAARGTSSVSHFVLDASVAGVWLLEDEDDPVANAAISRLATGFALVPQLWHLEVRNMLVVAERRGRMDGMGIEDGLRRVGELPIRTDTEPDLGAALALARRSRLTIYDALYLELALRADAPLATVDRALASAAVAEGRQLLGPLPELR